MRTESRQKYGVANIMLQRRQTAPSHKADEIFMPISVPGKVIRLSCLLAFVPLAMLFLLSCSTAGGNGKAGRFNLTLAHINDTHSHLEPLPVTLTIGGRKTVVLLGGFPRLQTLVDKFRASSPNFLLLHAGDAVQGSLYFTLFNGQVEFDFLNRLGVDAMTFGNHEFDRSVSAIPAYLDRARFPIVSANIDFADEPSVLPRVPPYTIREVNGERVGIIGVTTETTPRTTMDVGKTRFLDSASSVAKYVSELEGLGINKIVLISHLGFQEDLKIASSLNGIDVIVGGHSHTLLGDREKLAVTGLIPDAPYPVEAVTPDGGRSLVVQAWQWGHILGKLDIEFDGSGRIISHSAGASMPLAASFMRDGRAIQPDNPEHAGIVKALETTGMAAFVDEDAAAAEALAPYAEKLRAFRENPVASASERLARGFDTGPGVIAADSMIAAVPKAQAAILNFGGVRKDISAGPISVGDVLEVMPFSNTLVLVELSGEELKEALEEGIDFLMTKYGNAAPWAMPYVSGIRFSVDVKARKGNRVSSLMLKNSSDHYRPIALEETCLTVVNAFVANGGDGFSTIRNAKGFRSDTGIIDSDAFREYLKSLGTVRNPSEKRITLTENPITAHRSGIHTDTICSGRLLKAVALSCPEYYGIVTGSDDMVLQANAGYFP